MTSEVNLLKPEALQFPQRGSEGVVTYVILISPSVDINLGHEPELQNGWTRLQEKVWSHICTELYVHVNETGCTHVQSKCTVHVFSN